MGSYFKSWRRKLGVLTLAMACLFVAGWLRSRVIADIFCISSDRDRVQMVGSNFNNLLWLERGGDEPPMIYVTQEPMTDLTQNISIEWSWKWGGFQSVQGIVTQNSLPIAFWTVPYWSIVVPLTLASAYLLLSKPRARS